MTVADVPDGETFELYGETYIKSGLMTYSDVPQNASLKFMGDRIRQFLEYEDCSLGILHGDMKVIVFKNDQPVDPE